eukprot:CAMPEP_0203685324 /NCGR_PEP_ID=MMETSP0090-20130426/48483_1 /ASSEMBLY_ACC=CAM_ASM_001088 /TAXON_ID=426623 /ORGANISM="Chaetoceros affinis, Strain CCMP159" /LENGTH=767 /DNA_ID=CAMNT_0050554513 /DNA_START=70 /DNA_END=2373 /DNA_ORIENTATION=+
MSLYSAVSPNRGLVAVYSQPKDKSSQRLVIKCYDASVSVGSLKFTLSANLKKGSDDEQEQQGQVGKLLFSSNECLLASYSTPLSDKILVFDLNRGVHSQTIDLSSSSNNKSGSTSNAYGDLCAFTARENLIYALYKKQNKTIVVVYDIRKEGKVVAKIKCGSCEDDSVSGGSGNGWLDIAVHPNTEKGLIAVCIGKKLKIFKVADGSSPGKFKIKSNADSSSGECEYNSVLQFSPDGMYIVASPPNGNGAHIFSMKNWSKVGMVNNSNVANDISNIHVHAAPQGRYYCAIVSNHKSKVSLVEIGGSSSGKSNNNKNAVMEAFATIALPSSSTTTSNSTTIINEAFFASGNQGGFEVVLAELKPRGMNNFDVSMVQVPFKDESNQLLSGDLYPKPSSSSSSFAQEKGQSSITTDADAADGTVTTKKRKASQPSSNVVLGPGESGGEAMIVTDQTVMKRPKVIDNDNDDSTKNNNNNNKSNSNDGDVNVSDDDFALEQDDEAEQEETIAQRLALLSSAAMKRPKVIDNDNDDSTKNNNNNNKSNSNDGDVNVSDDDFALEQDDEAEQEETIAQRLALLSSELDRDTEDEEELLKIQSQMTDASSSSSRSNAGTKFMIKSATSDSLAILLQQSLSANDDTQLEVALQVSDKRVIENSILGLVHESDGNSGNDADVDTDASGEMIIMLLTKLVTRIARKPSRAQRLSFWIRTVLVALLSKAGSSSAVPMGKTEREIASRLGPLRNMLSERVESLPELLKLEGRLSLLSTKL